MPRALLAGLGGRGITWLDALRAHPEYTVAGCVEPVEARLHEIGAKYGLPSAQLYTDLETALRDAGAEILVDVTPPDAHERVVTAAFATGLDVLGEKPLAGTFEAAWRIVRAAQESGRTYMVAQNYRFVPLVRTTRRLIVEGKIGRPEYLDVGFYKGARFGGFRAEMDYPLLTDMSIHHFDLMRYILGTNPRSIYTLSMRPSWSWFKGDPTLSMVIEWENDALASYHGSWASLGRQTSWNGDWRIEGAEGSLCWEHDKLVHYFGDWREVQVNELDLDDLPETGQAAILTEFAAARREGRPPECSGADNINSIALVFAALASIQRDEKVLVRSLLHE